MVAQPARQRLRSSELLVQISSPRFLCYVVYHSVVSLPMRGPMKKGAAHRKPRRGVLGFLYLSFSSCMQVFGPKRSKTTPPHIGRSIRGKVGRRSWAGTSTTAGMRGLEPSRAWTQALYLTSPALPWAHDTNVRQGLMNRYAVHREPQWRMEGFRDT
ncbi:unnamed protein product, partial [Ascophyllum nodosum]